MALTPTEEALVRDLIAQNAALLSLAGSEPTIISKLGATKVNLSGLPAASALSPTDLLLTRQGTEDKSVALSLLNTTIAGNAATKTDVQASAYNYATAAGTANAIAATFAPVPTLVDGMTFFVKTVNPNTDIATFSPNGATARPIKKNGNVTLSPGDVAGDGHIIELVYDATNLQYFLRNPSNAINLSLLDFPEVHTATNEATVSVALLAGSGGTVTVTGNEFLRIGKEIVAGVSGINATVKIPAFTQNLVANSTYYLRGYIDNTTDSFIVYTQRGTDVDATPVGLKGTVNATSGGGFDSNVLDVLFARIVTGANGTLPVLTNLKNKSYFVNNTFDAQVNTPNRQTVAGGTIVQKRSSPILLNYGRLPVNYFQLVQAARNGEALEILRTIYSGSASDGTGTLTAITNRYIVDPVHIFDANQNGNISFAISLTTFISG